LRGALPSDEVDQFTEAGNQLAATIDTFISIDEALHYWSVRPEIVRLGKAAIAHTILEAERNSVLFPNENDGRVYLEKAATSWLRQFLMLALGFTRREDVEAAFGQVTLIQFNYDRTIEQYLYWGLQDQAGVSAETAKAAIANADFIQVYGSVGPLEWQQPGGLRFGHHGGKHLFEVSEGIFTYTEQRQTNVEERIRAALEVAEVLVFLGFGFHEQNLTLFLPKAGDMRGHLKAVFGTVYGIDTENHERLKNYLQGHLGLHAPAMLLERKCGALLESLAPSLRLLVR
jgi:hypothetical protein